LKKYTNIHITLTAFGQTLLALKIYSTRYVHYRFSALIASTRRSLKGKHPKFYCLSFFLCAMALNRKATTYSLIDICDQAVRRVCWM